MHAYMESSEVCPVSDVGSFFFFFSSEILFSDHVFHNLRFQMQKCVFLFEQKL